MAINDSRKVPLGYFLISKLSGKERANILFTCFELLYETGAVCKSVTFDGAPVNFAMCEELGANYKPSCLKPFFPHPITNQTVYTFLDPVIC